MAEIATRKVGGRWGTRAKWEIIRWNIQWDGSEFLAVKWGYVGIYSVGKKNTKALKYTERRGEEMESIR